jgi:hypothetical protein
LGRCTVLTPNGAVPAFPRVFSPAAASSSTPLRHRDSVAYIDANYDPPLESGRMTPWKMATKLSWHHHASRPRPQSRHDDHSQKSRPDLLFPSPTWPPPAHLAVAARLRPLSFGIHRHQRCWARELRTRTGSVDSPMTRHRLYHDRPDPKTKFRVNKL